MLYSKENLAQAIFRPSHPLQPNTKYFLKYENQTEQKTIDIKNVTKQVINGKNCIGLQTLLLMFPNHLQALQHSMSKVTEFGCGPAVFAIFDINSTLNQQTWYKTELLDVSTNTISTFYIQSNKNKLSVGHYMCFGAFSFNRKGTMYKVRFTPINSDRKTATTTDWISFKNPFFEN